MRSTFTPMSTATAEATIFDALPGQVMPVSEISPTLAEMWSVHMGSDHKVPTEFHASQMNLILHLGLKTPLEEARERFETLVAFAQKYPCRLIVLCPMGRERSDKLLEGKLFSQCYIGADMREQCCIEAIIVGYPTREAGFITNSVSVWVENDLPTYHWFNRVPAERIEAHHMEWVKRTTRVLYDSCVEITDFKEIPWPRPEAVADLALARLLPARQGIGQFLSATAPKDLVEGLKTVTVRHNEKRCGEGTNLLMWCRQRLNACAQVSGVTCDAEFKLEEVKDETNCLALEWTFEGDKHFLWTHKAGCAEAAVTADFGHGRVSVPMQIKFLEGEKALSEAIFFA